MAATRKCTVDQHATLADLASDAARQQSCAHLHVVTSETTQKAGLQPDHKNALPF